MRVYDPTAMRLLGEVEGRSVSVASPQATSMWIDVGVEDGAGGPSVGFDLDVTALDVTDAPSPFSTTVTLDPQTDAWFSTSVAPDELLAVHLGSKPFSTDIEIRDAGTLEIIERDAFASRMFWEHEEASPQDVIVRVYNRSSDTGGDVQIGIQTTTPAAIAVPGSASGEIPNPTTGDYYWIDVIAGQVVDVTATGTGAAFEPELAVYREGSWGRLERTAGTPLVYIPNEDQRLLLEVRDVADGGGGGMTFDLTTSTPSSSPMTFPFTESLTLDMSTPYMLYEASLAAGDTFHMFVDPDPTLDPTVEVYDAPTGELLAADFDPAGFGRHTPTARDLLFLVRSGDGTTNPSFALDLSAEILQVTDVTETTSDNSTVTNAQVLDAADLPTRVAASLDGSDTDVYEVTLTAGTSLRAFTTWDAAETALFYTEVRILDASETEITSSLLDGEAGFSYADIDVPADGTYYIEVSHWFGASVDPYSLVVLTR